MPIVNAEVAAIFEEIADLLEVQQANTFRVRAYRNAARTLGTMSRDLAAMVASGADLDALPGIGPDLAAKIAEIVRTGHCAQLDTLRHDVPRGLRDLLDVEGLGPVRVARLHDELGVTSLAQLRRAAQQGRLATVHGFGPALERRVLAAVETRLASPQRALHSQAAQIAEALVAEIAAARGVEQAAVAGSVRRGRDTVGDLDLVAAADDGEDAMTRFTTSPRVARVLVAGPTRASVVLTDGLQADLRVVPPASYGAAWLYFTGSRAHDIALRHRAHERGLKLNEYGLYRGRDRIAGQTEASIYEALGLPWIPPELREDRGEIEAALQGRLPPLIERAQLLGDLHVHSVDSDGHDTLEDLARAAKARGYQYLAITDHSRHLAVAHGLDAGRLAAQIDRIDKLNESLSGIRLLKGVEVDILEDGSLDLPDDVLRRLDLVVGAVHQGFTLGRARQTTRVLRAMSSPYFTILAHPTGRLLGERPPLELDLPAVIAHARERGCFLELDAQPQRLDLDDVACRLARDAGVLVSLASDAHRVAELDHVRFGVQQARRGWLAATDVLNTRPLEALRPLLERTMGRPVPAAPHRPRKPDRRSRQPA